MSLFDRLEKMKDSVMHNNNSSSNSNTTVNKSINNNAGGEQSDADEFESESLDPRIQVELERLNKSSGEINKMENELEEAKALFNTSRTRQLQRLEHLQKTLGACINKAKPFYEAIALRERLENEAQKSVIDYQRANSVYKVAKETLSVAETSLTSGEIPDAWQEHLSVTISKINLNKKLVDQAEETHRKKTSEFQQAEYQCSLLEKQLRKSIAKSQNYYDEKMRWRIQMEAQKTRIDELEQAIIRAKAAYTEAMLNLSKISEDIHAKRKLAETCLPPRESGVGAESPSECVDSLH